MSPVRLAPFATGNLCFLLVLTLLLVTGEGVAGAAALQTKLNHMVAAYPGRVALFARDLRTGRQAEINADEVVRTASTIKLAVLVEAFHQVREGRKSLADRVTMQAEDRVQGSGVLQYLQAPLDLTLEDVLVLMTIESDNTATNLAIDQVGLSNINARMAAMGLGDTYLYKKVFKPADEPVPSDQKRYGLGKTTPRQMAKLLESIHNCELGDEALCKRVVEILKNQQHRNSIPRFLESAVDASETPSQIANKTGALDADRSDVGIVYTKTGAFVIAAYTFENPDRRWTCDNQGELLIARMAKLIHDAWGRSPKGTPALK